MHIGGAAQGLHWGIWRMWMGERRVKGRKRVAKWWQAQLFLEGRWGRVRELKWVALGKISC